MIHLWEISLSQRGVVATIPCSFKISCRKICSGTVTCHHVGGMCSVPEPRLGVETRVNAISSLERETITAQPQGSALAKETTEMSTPIDPINPPQEPNPRRRRFDPDRIRDEADEGQAFDVNLNFRDQRAPVAPPLAAGTAIPVSFQMEPIQLAPRNPIVEAAAAQFFGARAQYVAQQPLVTNPPPPVAPAQPANDEVAALRRELREAVEAQRNPPPAPQQQRMTGVGAMSIGAVLLLLLLVGLAFLAFRNNGPAPEIKPEDKVAKVADVNAVKADVATLRKEVGDTATAGAANTKAIGELTGAVNGIGTKLDETAAVVANHEERMQAARKLWSTELPKIRGVYGRTDKLESDVGRLQRRPRLTVGRDGRGTVRFE